MTIIGLFCACGNQNKTYVFQTPQEALKTCHKELSKVKAIKKTNISRLANVTANWLALQDSVMNCIMRDSTAQNDIEVSADFFAVSDSFRTEITRLALADKRNMKDVIQLKVATATERKRIISSKDFRAAVEFYAQMDNIPSYPDVKTTLVEYEKLLTNTTPFKKEQELHQFIQQEDRCFRSLLGFLKDVPQEKLQYITDETSRLFDTLYSNSMAGENKVDERVMIYLNMRFNRRIIQNAETCREQIKTKIKLNEQLAANFRWMIIQPFMMIDNYAMAVLTDKQVEQLMTLAEELPQLMAYIDGKNIQDSSKDDVNRVTAILSEYFLKTYLKSIL